MLERASQIIGLSAEWQIGRSHSTYVLWLTDFYIRIFHEAKMTFVFSYTKLNTEDRGCA